MNKIVKLSILLGTIAMIMSFALAEIYAVTSPVIAMQQAEKTKAALETVLPEAKTGVIEAVNNAEGKVDYYIGYADEEKKNLAGFAFEAKKAGYSGWIPQIF